MKTATQLLNLTSAIVLLIAASYVIIMFEPVLTTSAKWCIGAGASAYLAARITSCKSALSARSAG